MKDRRAQRKEEEEMGRGGDKVDDRRRGVAERYEKEWRY